jgi:hypothetical protein
MKRLLRIVFTMRGLILAGTLMLAAIGGYLDRSTAPAAPTQPAAQVQARDGGQVPSYLPHERCPQGPDCPLWPGW